MPAVDIPAGRLNTLPPSSLDVATNGSQPAVERARTVVENAYPAGVASYLDGEAAPPQTLGETFGGDDAANNAYQQLADVVILTSLAIAGCTLAVSMAGGLAERKRAFSLQRLTGARLRMLRHVIVLESAVPLLAVAVVAVGTGFGAAAMYAATEMQRPTFPLLRRITGPDTARNE